MHDMKTIAIRDRVAWASVSLSTSVMWVGCAKQTDALCWVETHADWNVVLDEGQDSVEQSMHRMITISTWTTTGRTT